MDGAHSWLPGSNCYCDPGTSQGPPDAGSFSSVGGREEEGSRDSVSLRSQEAPGPSAWVTLSLSFFVLVSPGASGSSQDFWPGPPSPCRRPAWPHPFVCPQTRSESLSLSMIQIGLLCVSPLKAGLAYLLICSSVSVSQSICL